MSYYTREFSAFFEAYYTGWVRGFSPRLTTFLRQSAPATRSVLDLCCGTGVTAEVLCGEGWTVTGVDRSPGMLGVARGKLGGLVDAGLLRLSEQDARCFTLPRAVDAAVCLDGALNHFLTRADLERCFTRVGAVLEEGGQFLFDVFETSHFRHWDNLTLVDETDAVIAKRGVWDAGSGTGMLRVSGLMEQEGQLHRVNQTLHSRHFGPRDIRAALESAGLVPAEHDIESSYTKCESGSCSRTAAPCRTIYRAVKSST
ncbi:methyltransferase type 11 [Streptomyces nojiriensis]|uniref:Methyltransferase type 11 n=1 Tax=Streptomyces nojiriensis TaxID=66374 RepID=A0ABQ3SHJ0_9ACTN|nr:class I SAM-dependent methyltransferase [Streptomyces nojiriensis]QTI49240.1 dTDP-3-amino-3,6-dideoxy-alpha-D-glucopyranose N,N-dimethyltransferase [Streptomyces nojiriensis]GGS10362.1 methyltransferase type 11 [Streptomyces nojiriensis]GHI67613.1 methyltransferase type 11 [Streptomyces nojiriensis]